MYHLHLSHLSKLQIFTLPVLSVCNSGAQNNKAFFAAVLEGCSNEFNGVVSQEKGKRNLDTEVAIDVINTHQGFETCHMSFPTCTDEKEKCSSFSTSRDFILQIAVLHNFLESSLYICTTNCVSKTTPN